MLQRQLGSRASEHPLVGFYPEQEAEANVEEAWASEILKRVAAARAGELASADWRTVLQRVEAEVLGR
ncbi:MAG TPA: hypothetical protein VNA69_12950 [Thermoanaerobaculia bacterium]|nr:hypothetical protein [Thermoanaerobaculia bacterium]